MRPRSVGQSARPMVGWFVGPSRVFLIAEIDKSDKSDRSDKAKKPVNLTNQTPLWSNELVFGDEAVSERVRSIEQPPKA